MNHYQITQFVMPWHEMKSHFLAELYNLYLPKNLLADVKACPSGERGFARRSATIELKT